MAKKTDFKERIYTIPLRKAYRKPYQRRASYAIKIISDFLYLHTKAEEIKLGKELNHDVWKRGIRYPPRRVKVKAVKDGNVAKVELMGYEYKDFKALPKSEKKGIKDKLMGRLSPKAMRKEAEEKLIEGEEKAKKEEKSETKEIPAEKEASHEKKEDKKEEIKKEAPKVEKIN